MHNLDEEAGRHMSGKDLWDQLAHLPKVPEKPSPGMRVETLVVHKVIVAGRLMHLQGRGLIIYMVDFNPLRDFFQDWALDLLGRRMQINIEQIKVLTRCTFMIVVSSHEEQKAILMEPYLFMGRRMVMAMPWTPDFNATGMK